MTPNSISRGSTRERVKSKNVQKRGRLSGLFPRRFPPKLFLEHPENAKCVQYQDHNHNHNGDGSAITKEA